MLIAMEASGCKVAQIVRAAVHSSFLVFNGETGRAALRELALAIATFPALALSQMSAHPRTILKVS